MTRSRRPLRPAGTAGICQSCSRRAAHAATAGSHHSCSRGAARIALAGRSRRVRGAHRHPLVGERGSGSILVVALLGALFTITAVLIPVLALLPANQAVQGAADAAALAAADTASGLMPGVPCDTAALAAQLNEASLVACAVDGLIATVTVARTVGVITIGSRARAGPAP